MCALPDAAPRAPPSPHTQKGPSVQVGPLPSFHFGKRGEETVWGLPKGAELEGVSPVSWVRTSWDLLARSRPPTPGRADSLEKNLMLGKIEGRRRRG